MKQDMNDTFRIALRAMVVAAMTLLASSTATAQGPTVHGNVYGGGNLADVKENTAVNMSAGQVYGNVYGGGKGKADNFKCDKAMVGEEKQENACADPASNDNKDKGTIVTISNGTVGTLEGEEGSQTLKEGTGNVYGGGEIGRVEWNTQVRIGVGTEGGTFAPVIYGNVFGAGKGLETHGYSALVRGNSTVTIQGNAKVGYNVYGGGEMSTVGRYWVKGIPITYTCDGETVPTAPETLPDEMPYKTRRGGKITVTVQGKAQIGPDNGATETAGHVFGAGKGITPNYVQTGDKENWSRRMVDYKSTKHTGEPGTTWDYYEAYTEDQIADTNFPKYVWEYFVDDANPSATNYKSGKDKYFEFLQTLALVTGTEVTIGGDGVVKGNVYGGSESGFVQDDTRVTIEGESENFKIGTTTYGNVFGGGKGLETFAEAGKVKGTTMVAINNGTVSGNVYGGGELGDVGIIDKTEKEDGKLTYNYHWKQSDGNTANVTENNKITVTNNNTGICKVTVSGGTIGTGGTASAEHGNVYGAGKGTGITWWCEKAISYATSVTITAGTVNGNVYGGGQVGRVEDDAKVMIGTAGATGDSKPTITGSVFGAGAGLETHGYSALVRGNAEVTVQGTAQIGGSVYGGGETASVGKFEVVGGLPTKPKTGGTCIVNIKDNARIGESGTGHNVYGACKGVEPTYVASGENRSKSMQLLTNAPSDNNLWSYYEGDETSPFIWRYYATEQDYLDFLKTLALTSHPHVTIGGTYEMTGTITPSGSPTVYGSVYGGGQRGVTLGHVDVNMVGGTVEQDVYGGGALADTNLGNWDVNGYVEATGLTAGAPVTGLYTRTESEGKYTYTKITAEDAMAVEGTTYYRQEATWAHEEGSAYYTTTVDLTGGTIKGDAYGGGLGQKTGFNDAQGVTATKDIEAVVWGDINVNLGSTSSSSATAFYLSNYDGDYSSVAKSGRIFGCNNLNGSPQGNVTVTVYSTVRSKDSEGNNIARTVITRDDKGEITSVATPHQYDVAAVYGGGNLAGYTTTGKKASVRIWTCEASVHSVYGGGNAAAVPETDVLVRGAYEIEEVFGGGNGKDSYTIDGGTHWETNPGANVNGNATTLLTGGFIHEAYGGSNSKGTISGNVSIDKSSGGDCTLRVDDLYGAGKDADIEGDLIMVLGCSQTRTENIYGCSKNANVKGNVELTITSGEYGRVFGGNNESGSIFGHIIVNIEEVGCSPIIIDELYGCGNDAAYSVYGYYHAKKYAKTESGEEKLFLDKGMTIPLYKDDSNNLYKDEGKTIPLYKDESDFLFIDQEKTRRLYMPRTSANDPNDIVVFSEHPHTVLDETKTQYDDPIVNIISCTRIGKVFGGGLGEHATVYGNPQVNINMMKGAWAGETDQLGKVGDGYTDADAKAVEGGVFGGGNEASVEGNTTVNIGNLIGEQVDLAILDNAGNPIKNDDGNYTFTPATVTGANITGSVYGGGNLANVGRTHLEKDANNKDIDKIDVVGNTFVNICAVKGEEIVDAQSQATGRYNYTSVSLTGGAQSVTIAGNVFGGGKGEAAEPIGTDALPGAFRCGKAMVTGSTNVAIGNGTIGNGTVGGNIYGGGEVGRVEVNTTVTIGCENDANSKPVITGNVFGAGKGVNTHGYSALARGNSYVTVQGEAKVKKSVYGGGEIASVGKYNIVSEEDLNNPSFVQEHPGLGLGMPWSLANQGSGYCYVIVRDDAVIGPDAAMVMTATGNPDDMGHVFGAGKGVLPYEGFVDDKKAWRVTPSNKKQEYLSKNEAIAGIDEKLYLPYVETLGLATQTYVTIDENAFVKGSVYGGSENGYVQHDTQVNIKGYCQIGNGYVQMDNDGVYLSKLETPETPMGVNRRYTDAEWTAGKLIPDQTKEPELYALVNEKYYTSSLPECASWPYGQKTGDDKYAPWDKYDGTTNYDSKGGRTTADDGHTFYGNVFGGGSGVIPYRPGQWHPEAGSVGGNTVMNITGGHILTNIYGGNELTDVYGKCTVNFGGTATLGVPRTLKQIAAHPLTCYLFGAGKGDQRVLFNKSTNVEDVEVNITGGTIYGSVFGGGEDGHVHRDVKMTIGNNDHTGPTIGQWGTSYVDGNIFGGGRGFGADAYTAGNVAGSVKLEIKGGDILGSVYGGGRLGSVGYGLFESTNTANYGVMQDDNKDDEGNETTFYKDGAVGLGRGHIDITISGGTIGNGREYIIPNAINMAEANIPEDYRDISKWDDDNNYWTQWKEYHKIPKTEFDTKTGQLTHTKGGNVFAGGMGNFYKQDGKTYISDVNWWQLGSAKSTKLTITGGTIKSNVYGGGELGQVVGHHTFQNAANEDVPVSTEISISGNNTQIGTEVKNGETTEYTFGSVFGSGYGSLIQSITVNDKTSYPRLVAGLVKEDTKIDMQGGAVKASIYGGGEMASVGESTTSGTTTTATGSTYVSVSGGTVGIEPITVSGETRYFGGAKMGNVYGGGSGDNGTVRSGKIFKNTNVNISGGTIYHNVYGGGAYGTVGNFNYTEDTNNRVIGVNGLATAGTGVANVTITGGTIGYDGRENGMVFGSSRGDIAEPGARDDFCAWVYDTHVTIGFLAEGTEGQEGYVPATAPQINGSVYGGGENGHTFNDTEVIIHSGTVGIEDGSPINGLSGANYPTRGNVYGGGCGTDTYGVTTGTGNGAVTKTYFNRLSGIVRGNTSVSMDGGHVVRSIYGGGAMGSVGVFERSTTDATDNNLPGSITGISSGGKCTVSISGGKVGPATLTMPMNAGMVFGAGRGEVHDLTDYPNLERVVYVNKTDVTINGTAFVKGSVYGGAESGHVFGDTHVTIDGSCQIGCGYDKTFNNGEGKEPGKDLDRVYTTSEWAYDVTADDTKFLYECNSWPFTEPYTPYDKFADDNGKYPNGENADNAHQKGTDGHTFYGNVFGGGSGFEPYAPGKWLPTAGWVQGNTLVEIKGGHILTSVYGGNEMSDVGSGGVQKMTDLNHETPDMFYDITKPGGKCIVKMSGGTLGVPRTLDQIAAHPLTCYLFGAGKGDQRIFFNKTTNVKEVEIEISGGRIYGSVFGGGEDGHVMRDVKMTIKDGSTTTGEGEQAVTTTTSPIIGTWGTSYVDGNVFGGGRGFSGEALTAGNVGGSVNIDIQGGKMLGSIYGGGRLGSVGYGLYLVDEKIGEVKPYGVLRDDNVDDRGNTVAGFKRGYITINISGGTIGNDIEYKYNPTDADKQKMPSTQFDYQNHLTYTRGGNVFTGCMGRLYALDNRTLLPLWTKLGRCNQTELNITGGTIKSNVYGGAELGVVQKDATVNIIGGTVGTKVGEGENAYYYGSVFGSGKGSNDAITYPEGTADKTDISEAGTVEGNVTVELNNRVAESENKKGGVVHKIFGCNDMNGTPKGTVTVHVYATQKEGVATINDKATKAATAEDGTYDVEAVYGGGNLAAYVPTNAVSGSDEEKLQARPEVIIDGCGLTSIGTVYGGGNAASVPATNVTVNGTYEIGYVFGGGNGMDKLPSGDDNPGANVGYFAYTDDSEKESKVYGSGKAHATIYGGTVHKVYGGSNTKGNVRVESRTTLIEEVMECEYDVREAYGGGNNALQDGNAVLEAGCIRGLDIAYGGASNADVNGDVILNITNGTYGRVFAGNNLGGTIRGTITVNIEETGCRPIIIGELYGGGNLAEYSVEDIDKSRTDINFTDQTADNYYKNFPKVNVKSFTSIGKIFGGGYGKSAEVTGNPQVNINVCEGKYYNTFEDDDNVINDNAKVVGVNVKYSESDAGYANGYPIPSHAKGAIGAINEVFGGGNEAAVIGNPTVNIGTEAGEEEYVAVEVKAGDNVSGYYTRNEASYTAASGTAVDGTTYYLKTHKAADIRGNVFGGGNNAPVTGNTNVVIGKKAE